MARGFASRGSSFRGNFRGRANSFRGRGNRGRGGATATSRGPTAVKEDDGSKAEARFEQIRIEDEIDEKLGFRRYQEGPPREGWMINMRPVCVFQPLKKANCDLLTFDVSSRPSLKTNMCLVEERE